MPALFPACISKDRFKNDTQVLLVFKISIFHFVYKLATSTSTDIYLTSSNLTFSVRTRKKLPLDEGRVIFLGIMKSFIQINCQNLGVKQNSFQFIIMFRLISPDSTNSDMFYVERLSGEQSITNKNTPDILNWTELFRALAREVVTISTIASAEPHIVTTESNSNEHTRPYGYGRQQTFTIPSLNDLNLPVNTFNVLMPVSLPSWTDAQGPKHSELFNFFRKINATKRG